MVMAFRKLHCSVADLSDVGNGVGDLLVGYRGHSHMVELKGPIGRFTVDQTEFRERWRGDYHVVRSLQDVIDLVAEWSR
jgi:hypothetical protein